MTIKELYKEAKKLNAENFQLYTIDEDYVVVPIDFQLTLISEENDESWLCIKRY